MKAAPPLLRQLSPEIMSVFTHAHAQICASIHTGWNHTALYQIPVDSSLHFLSQGFSCLWRELHKGCFTLPDCGPLGANGHEMAAL